MPDQVKMEYSHITTELVWTTLTPREKQILYWVLRGYRNRQIADMEDIVVDHKTVERHVHAIYEKTGAGTNGGHPRVQLLVLAIRDGIMPILEEDGQFSQDPRANNVRQLTRKERMIGDLMCLGKTNLEIAAIMGLGHQTIKTYARIMKLKLGIGGDNHEARERLIERLKLEK